MYDNPKITHSVINSIWLIKKKCRLFKDSKEMKMKFATPKVIIDKQTFIIFYCCDWDDRKGLSPLNKKDTGINKIAGLRAPKIRLL